MSEPPEGVISRNKFLSVFQLPPMAKLSRRDVAEIVRRLNHGNATIYRIAREFGVSERWIREIRRRYWENEQLPGLGRVGRPPKPITQDELDFVYACELRHHLHPVALEDKIEKTYGVHIPHNRLWKLLKMMGRVEDTPSKQRRRSWVRFERRHSNSLWQMDYTQLSNRKWLLVIIDDASRLIVGYAQVPKATAQIAWETFLKAGEMYGFPRQLLTDHGSQFTKISTDAVGYLDERLHEFNKGRKVKVEHIMSRVKHPQTGGKVERVFGTIKSKLRARWPHGEKEFDSLEELMVWYNTDKPHMSLNTDKAETPIDAFIRKLRPNERKEYLKRHKEEV
jgi:putative transposase